MVWRIGEFIIGDNYTIADITALVTIDFAKWMKQTLPESAGNARRWYEAVSSRAERQRLATSGEADMYDVVISNGRVINPLNQIDAVMDVAIHAGKIAKVAPGIDDAETTRSIDATGKLVTPGLVDIHAHVIGPGGIDVDGICGVGAGVTSIIDAGGAMAADLPGALEVATPSDVYSLLTNHNWPSGYGPSQIDPVDTEAVRDAISTYPDSVLGIKVALTPAIVDAYGLDGLKKAREVAADTGTRVMLHIGDIGNPALEPTPSSVTSEALGMLQAGDILTHVYSPLTGGPLDEHEKLLPALGEACERGVVMDAAKGDYGFGWEAADQILGKGIKPDTVSSDVELHSPATTPSGLMVENRRATGARVKSELSLVEYMAFFLELGFSVEEVIRMTTSARRRSGHSRSGRRSRRRETCRRDGARAQTGRYK